jgi:hypothetical protein
MSEAALLKQAITAIRIGDPETAREILPKILEDDSYHEDTWLWLTRTAKTRTEQREYLEKVLGINSGNAPAQKALASKQLYWIALRNKNTACANSGRSSFIGKMLMWGGAFHYNKPISERWLLA